MNRRRSLFAHVVLTVLAVFAAGPARACLNDRDTIAAEARQYPDVIRVISGRFERNPPLYYQMRIDREKAELLRHPDLLADYDDISVAYDRLGDDVDAIAWIEKKHRLLPRYNPHKPALKEQWYRYWANAGTVRVHKWIRDGADPKVSTRLWTPATVSPKR